MDGFVEKGLTVNRKSHNQTTDAILKDMARLASRSPSKG